MPSLSIQDIAKTLGAIVHGDACSSVSGIRPLQSAGPNELSFFAPTSKRKHAELFQIAKTSKAAALLVSQYFPEISTTQLVVQNPLIAVATLSAQFYPSPRPPQGIHSTAVVSPSAVIDPSSSVGPFVVIGDAAQIEAECILHPHVVVYHHARIGKGSEIHSGATIREHVVVGPNSILQNGVVLGADGFGYVPDKELGHRKIPQVGTVVLGNGVEVGANSTIDRATLGETCVGENSKIDNMVMVGHNVHIGKRVLVCAQTGIAGSSTIGDDCVLGARTGVADHITIGSQLRCAAETHFRQDHPGKADVGGPGISIGKYRRHLVAQNQLYETYSDVQKLKRLVLDSAEKKSK